MQLMSQEMYLKGSYGQVLNRCNPLWKWLIFARSSPNLFLKAKEAIQDPRMYSCSVFFSMAQKMSYPC